MTISIIFTLFKNNYWNKKKYKQFLQIDTKENNWQSWFLTQNKTIVARAVWIYWCNDIIEKKAVFKKLACDKYFHFLFDIAQQTYLVQTLQHQLTASMELVTAVLPLSKFFHWTTALMIQYKSLNFTVQQRDQMTVA